MELEDVSAEFQGSKRCSRRFASFGVTNKRSNRNDWNILEERDSSEPRLVSTSKSAEHLLVNSGQESSHCNRRPCLLYLLLILCFLMSIASLSLSVFLWKGSICACQTKYASDAGSLSSPDVGDNESFNKSLQELAVETVVNELYEKLNESQHWKEHDDIFNSSIYELKMDKAQLNATFANARGALENLVVKSFLSMDERLNVSRMNSENFKANLLAYFRLTMTQVDTVINSFNESQQDLSAMVFDLQTDLNDTKVNFQRQIKLMNEKGIELAEMVSTQGEVNVTNTLINELAQNFTRQTVQLNSNFAQVGQALHVDIARLRTSLDELTELWLESENSTEMKLRSVYNETHLCQKSIADLFVFFAHELLTMNKTMVDMTSPESNVTSLQLETLTHNITQLYHRFDNVTFDLLAEINKTRVNLISKFNNLTGNTERVELANTSRVDTLGLQVTAIQNYQEEMKTNLDKLNETLILLEIMFANELNSSELKIHQYVRNIHGELELKLRMTREMNVALSDDISQIAQKLNDSEEQRRDETSMLNEQITNITQHLHAYTQEVMSPEHQMNDRESFQMLQDFNESLNEQIASLGQVKESLVTLNLSQDFLVRVITVVDLQMAKNDLSIEQFNSTLNSLYHPPPVPSCLDGYQGNPLSGTCYRVVKLRKTWYEAKLYCEAASEHLATLINGNSGLWLSVLLVHHPAWLIGDVWLGGRYSNGSWSWEGRMTTRISEDLWAPTQPGSNQGCTDSRRRLGYSLVAFNCTHPQGFICERHA